MFSAKTMDVLYKTSSFLFIAGAIIGLLFVGMVSWSNLEASFYASGLAADESLSTLRCPIFITQNEQAEISASVTNPTDQPLKVVMISTVSQGMVSLVDSERHLLTLAANETQSIQAPISAADAAWQYFVMARVERIGSGPLRSAAGSCGVFVLSIPFGNGNVIAGTMIAASLLCMALGAWLWLRAHQPLSGRPLFTMNGMLLLAGIITIGIVVSLLGLWMAGILIIAVSILLGLAVTTYNLSNV